MDAEIDAQGLIKELQDLGYSAKPAPQLGTRQAFDWVADCLLWLCQRAAPDLSLARDYSSEQKRTAFITSLGSQLYARTRVRLNLRRLYRAGGGALRELRRLAGLLSTAAATPAGPPVPLYQQVPTSTDAERAELRELAQRIGASGAQLVAALAAAPAAAAGLAGAATDVGAAERELAATAAAARQEAAALEKEVGELGLEVQAMEARVEKRHVELDRLERRLDSLQMVRPAFRAEAEELEGQLSGLFQQYLHRFRNLEWLEGCLDAHGASRRAAAEEADKQLRRIQRQVAADELRLLQGDQNGTPNTPAGLPARLDSEDSETAGALGGWGPKALPRLGGGAAAAVGGTPGAGGKGSPGARSVSFDLQLLPEEEESGGRGGTAGKGGASRLGLASSEAGSPAGEAASGGGGGKASLGGANPSPAPRAGGSAPTNPLRPGSAARRATGSANALLRARGGGGGGGGGGGSDASSPGAVSGADVLELGGPRARRGSLGDNDF